MNFRGEKIKKEKEEGEGEGEREGRVGGERKWHLLREFNSSKLFSASRGKIFQLLINHRIAIIFCLS